MEDLLNIKVPVVVDDSVAHYDIHAHLPYSPSGYRNSEDIRICIQNQDQYLLPSKSSLHIQGKLTQPNGDAIAADTVLVRNAICHLFSDIRYTMNAVEIDKCKNVGLTVLMKSLVSLTPNQQRMLDNSGWNPEQTIDARGNFDVVIPLNLIFGFAEDYRKIVVNTKHELILTRSGHDRNAVIQTRQPAPNGGVVPALTNYAFSITKIEWLMPYLVLSDVQKSSLLRVIEKDPAITMSFRSWEMFEYPELPAATKHVWTVKTSTQLEKPRFVILGFQSSRNNLATANASEFDHCNLSNVKLYLNSQYYPYCNMNLNITNNQYAILYEMYCNFQAAYYGKNMGEPFLNKNDFITSSPLIIIDCSRQNDAIKNGAVDVRLEFEVANNFPAGTSAYCLILHDRMVQYKPISGDVRKMT